ncbi:DUF3606 domain-containing protein [Flaviflagellibacter deserti]|jgi:hypothetical protein|uniref:DUF3606 domain-containing protein n=1 Tax=Flaviflagellibacter deserti TaxID=2267266 RepID=A0ABV9YWD7_9HYPH
MGEDPLLRLEAERTCISGLDECEVAAFALDAGIARSQVYELIKKYGNDRKTLLAAAQRLTDSNRA